MCSFRVLRSSAVALLAALSASLVAAVVLAAPASAAPPTYVVAGDPGGATGDQWGLHEAYFSELRSIITDAANFGADGRVRATFTIGAPRTLPLTSGSLNGVDVYFLSARDLQPGEPAVLTSFVAAGGAVVASANAPAFFDTTAWAGFSISSRVVFGDGPAPYNVTHRAPSQSAVVPAQAGSSIMSGPFGTVTTFDNWHTVAGFSALPADAVALARTTLTGPDAPASVTNATITNVVTLAAVPAGARGAGSGPIIATSDVDTFGNAYTSLDNEDRFPTDAANTLNGTANGVLARNAFAWIAEQLTQLDPPTSGFVPLQRPVRVLDTRSSGGAFTAGQTRNVSLAAAGVPGNAEMVAVNLTAVDPSAVGYLTAWPAGQPMPTVSSVNFVPGRTVANAAFIKVGSNGQFSILNSAGGTHVLVDVVGYVAPSTGSRLVNVAPARIKDTRSGLGGTGIAGPNTTQSLRVAGAGGVPNGATAAILNVTAIDPTATAYVTVWPGDQSQPTVSNINTVAGTTVPNLVVVRLPVTGSATGSINLYNAAGDTHLVVDVLGYYTGTGRVGFTTAMTPFRAADTRSAAALDAGEARIIQTGVRNAEAVILNVTAVDPTATGYLTVFAANENRPDASNVNFYAGRAAPNLVIVRPDADGAIRIFNSAGRTHVLVDVVGAVDN